MFHTNIRGTSRVFCGSVNVHAGLAYSLTSPVVTGCWRPVDSPCTVGGGYDDVTSRRCNVSNNDLMSWSVWRPLQVPRAVVSWHSPNAFPFSDKQLTTTGMRGCVKSWWYVLRLRPRAAFNLDPGRWGLRWEEAVRDTREVARTDAARGQAAAFSWPSLNQVCSWTSSAVAYGTVCRRCWIR